jgi:FkbM family methyltransferase
MSDKLHWAIIKAGIQVRKAVEVGVLSFETSAIKSFIETGVTCDLYEAVPEFCKNISKSIAPFNNAALHEMAVSDFDGNMELCMAGPSTFNAAQEVSPAINHDGYDKANAKVITVKCVDFAAVDPGDYDLVTIDVEGGEYAVLSRMKSRPRVIALETQSRDYCNPKLGAITDWMLENGYRVWLWNDTDTVFYKGKPPSLGVVEDLKAKWHSFRYFASRI